MMKSVFLASFALLFGAAVACADETGAPVDLATKDWVLVLMDGVAPGYQATLNLDAPGRVTGIAPCNRYFADLVQDGDSFKLSALGSTKMACPDMMAEQDFFQALHGVDTAVQQDGQLRLSGNGHELVFAKAAP